MRVMVVDDDLITREGLASLLTAMGHQVVETAADGSAAVTVAREVRPDAVVLDIRMPPTHTTEGLRAATHIQQDLPGTAVLVLSQYLVTEYALTLMQTYPGRMGYLLKERIVDRAMLSDALTRLTRNECVIDPSIVARLMRRRRRNDILGSLTDREKEVLDLIAQGHSNVGIAKKLVISERTVETHATQVFQKLGLIEVTEMNRRVLAVLTLLDRSE